MIKLLIADDEPLVQIGVKSMLNWADFGIEVCATALNGEQALELIEKFSPEIVISDIKMPVINGLELAKICKERFGKLPLFIILTSYEEFQLVKEALNYQVVDYLVKLELDKNILEKSIKKALEIVVEAQRQLSPQQQTLNTTSLQLFYDKFFIKLLHNLFDSEFQFKMQMKELSLSFNSLFYAVGYCEITNSDNKPMENNTLMSLYSSTIQMVREIITKYLPCYITSLDMKHFCIIFCFDTSEKYKDEIKNAIDKSFEMTHNYFNVIIKSSIGRLCETPFLISESYQDARQCFSTLDTSTNLLFYEDIQNNSTIKSAFNFSLFKEDIAKAFEEFDTDALKSVFTQISELFLAHPTRYSQAMDAACNILFLALSLLPDGEGIVSEIFEGYPDNYRCIYKHTNVEQIVNWLNIFCNGLCSILSERRKEYKNHIVSNVRKYINTHITEKLTLNDVATTFGISPSYLSLLFKKYNDVGFSEYISQCKISKAKELMTDGNLKIYEIAEYLGFENAFYFSKVFKKITGHSPKQYSQNKT